jgi:hypothetical protein
VHRLHWRHLCDPIPRPFRPRNGDEPNPLAGNRLGNLY